MAKFVKSSRPVSSNVSSNALGSMPTNLGSMPTNLGSMPTNLGSMPVAAPVAASKSRVQSSTIRDPQPTELSKMYMEGVNKLINGEVAKLLEKIKEINEKLTAVDEHLNGLDMFRKDIESRVKDIEDYLEGDTEMEPANDNIEDDDVNDNIEDDDVNDNIEDGDVNDNIEDGDVITLEDIDVAKVLAFMRKEPNTAVKVVRSVRSALGRKQFAISEIQKDEDALAECLEALETMGIDLEQFTND